ncbi:DNA cytosine methyltransferase [Spirosoma agri]|uniref:DNA (cytosine-5-)-methyltransferase n=1 Tax=Spirosoma agri TaxID=1987381 RepID=A0A6M0ISJ3_9BACT|nr:DNA cytosine methyltransferase [Spirosoma agri]NEU70575.1 DNA cytosine methyltransferase [Spirosoma agri]
MTSNRFSTGLPKTLLTTEDYFVHKRNRLHSGLSPRALDLFGGCGGLSLGFKKAGFEIVASVEIDETAAKSHAINFHPHDPVEKHSSRDIQQTEPADLVRQLGLQGDTAAQIDVIIGGPPCQAFTRIGRAKLREVKNDSNAFLNDARSQLYKRYLHYVREFRPLAILMENVPDILNYGGINIAESICDDLSALGYRCAYTLLNSVYYGVPQMRERMFLIGLHESVETEIFFPIPTHTADLPRGYHGSRNVALQTILRQSVHQYFRQPPDADSHSLIPAVTAEDALSDLPRLTDHLNSKFRRGTRRISDVIAYANQCDLNEYQQQMRNWEGYETNGLVNANLIRYLPRDFSIFGRMNPGDQYPQALQISRELFQSRLQQISEGKRIPGEKTRVYQQLKKATIPPYSDEKFPNKWRKMEADKPSRTLMAHLGKDSYSHIHYDSLQARTISVREAARLQSFPDGFEFAGAMNAAFRQIGNAVPPLMASKLAGCLRHMLASI